MYAFICFPYLCTFVARKIIFAAVFFIRYVCEYLIYRKTPKTLLFAVCSRFRVLYVVSTIFRFWYVCIRLFLFSFSLAFCFTKIMCETLCKFLYVYARLICMFMQSVMINRKLFGNFGFFGTFAEMFYIFTFYLFAFSLILDNLQKEETETKKPYFCRFCHKTSVFVANKTLIFSVLWVYRANYHPPPPFLALAGWVSSRPKFFIFLFFIFFVKYFDFSNSAFLPNFEHF